MVVVQAAGEARSLVCTASVLVVDTTVLNFPDPPGPKPTAEQRRAHQQKLWRQWQTEHGPDYAKWPPEIARDAILVYYVTPDDAFVALQEYVRVRSQNKAQAVGQPEIHQEGSVRYDPLMVKALRCAFEEPDDPQLIQPARIVP